MRGRCLPAAGTTSRLGPFSLHSPRPQTAGCRGDRPMLMRANALPVSSDGALPLGPTGPKIPRVTTERRTQILDAAARLIGSRGYVQTSVDDVIREAGLSGKSHFYHYFRSKEELGYEVLDRQVDRFTERGLAMLREPMIDA